MLNFDVKRKINTLRDILVGKVPDPKAQVEQITIALIYKFMDDMDLEGMDFGASREFFKEDYEKYAWTNIMQSENSGQQRLNLYAEGIEKMSMNSHLPQLFRDIFRGAYIPYRDPETLNMFLKEINDFTYDHSEDLGNAFEYLLSIMGSQGDAGQFRTPRHIIDMIVKIVDPQKTDSILDPACGTAGFLISSYKHILEKNKDKEGNSTLSADERKRMTESFAGYDISPDMVRLSRVNMYLHKFAKPQISEYDTLSSLEKWDETYDIILANPPFMTPKGGIIPHNRYRIPAKRAEVLFVDYIAEHLNPTGKAGVIVPEGIVFQSANAYKSLRKFLIEDNLVYAVISLPAGVFNPYSGVKTSILLIDKTVAKQRNEILFVRLNNDGYDLGAQRREISGSDIPEVIKIVKDYQNGLDVSENELVTMASKKDIAEQDYILAGVRYKENVVVNSVYPMVEMGEVCDLVTGYAFKSDLLLSEMTENSLPVIKIGNLQSKSVLNLEDVQYFPYDTSMQKYLINKNDLLLAMTGATVGKVSISDSNNLLLNQRVANIKANIAKINPEYLKYILFDESFYDYCQANAGGGAQGNISPKEIRNYKIPLPSLNIQEEIVKEFEGYQKIIDGAKQVVENYKPTIKINTSWETKEIGEMYEISYGVTISIPQNEDNNGIKIISTAEVGLDGSLNLDKIRKIKFENKYKKFILKPNTLLFNWRNAPKHVGKTALFNELNDEYISASFLLSLTNKDVKNINNKYIWCAINNLRETGYFMRNARQAVNQTNFNGDMLSKTKLVVPNIEVQNEMVSQIEEEMYIVEKNKRLIELFEQKIKLRISEVWGE